MIMFLLVAASAFSIACLVTFLLARPGGRFQILDQPNERSLHSSPISRTGGLAIWAGGGVAITAVLALLGVRSAFVWIVTAALLVGIVSFADDRFSIPVGIRLAAHVAAAGLLLIGGLGLPVFLLPGSEIQLPSFVGVFLGMLFIVWMTNLYNFMDGMDGFAGGMAVFGFGTLGVLGHIAGDGYFAALCWAIAAAAGGFLVLNFPPARIFMGDTGSSVLGLMAAAMSLWGDKLGLFPLWVAILVFSPFIVDATVTLIWRALRKERIWEAHRNHYYQRLVQFGWGHKKTVLAEYVLMVLCAGSAVFHARLSVSMQWGIIVFWVFAYVCLISAVEHLHRRSLQEGI